MRRPICNKCNDRECEISVKTKDGRDLYRKLCWKCRSLENPEKYQARYPRYYKKLKEETITAYGGKCQCCSEDNILFLTIDHINNDGHKDRKNIGGGYMLHRWLRKNNYPKDNYRILCFNCNCGRQLNNGICPHKIK